MFCYQKLVGTHDENLVYVNGIEIYRPFLVRSGQKQHGTKKAIEGPPLSDTEVVIVEDVVSTGGSIMSAIEEVEKLGSKVVLILSIVDREMGARNKFLELNIEYDPIFRISELIEPS